MEGFGVHGRVVGVHVGVVGYMGGWWGYCGSGRGTWEGGGGGGCIREVTRCSMGYGECSIRMLPWDARSILWVLRCMFE